MAKPPYRKSQNPPARTWVPTLVTCVSWTAVTLSALVMLRREPGLLVFGLGLTGLAVNLFVARWAERPGAGSSRSTGWRDRYAHADVTRRHVIPRI